MGFFVTEFMSFFGGGDVCRICGGVLICLSHKFTVLLGGFWRSCRRILLGRIFSGRVFFDGFFSVIYTMK